MKMNDYISREAATNVLCDACGNAACPRGMITRCSYYERMQAIPAADVIPGRWIPVEKLLPEDMQDTLCCFDEFIATATYMAKYKDWELRQDAGEVTHWMPLPEPPGKETR